MSDIQINDFQKQINFILEMDKSKNIFRQTYLSDASRFENDAEHAWHLGIMAMVLGPSFGELDLLKCMKMVLVHDLVEIDAGDTYCYDKKAGEDKAQREQAAADRIFAILPKAQGEEIRALWEEFEAQKTKEAVFCACLDRIQPLLLQRASGGKSWKENGISASQVYARCHLVMEQKNQLSELVTEIIEDARQKGLLKDE